jgi:hypothetical protein
MNKLCQVIQHVNWNKKCIITCVLSQTDFGLSECMFFFFSKIEIFLKVFEKKSYDTIVAVGSL